MPKKKLTELEIHSMIVNDAKMRLGCAQFMPDFTLYETRDVVANWDLHSARNVHKGTPDCTEAFYQAVARARSTFDIAWP